MFSLAATVSSKYTSCSATLASTYTCECKVSNFHFVKKTITSLFILVCWHEALVDVLGNFLHMKSKQKLKIRDVEAVLNNFCLDFALECPNLDENFFQVDFNSGFEIQLQCISVASM